MDSAQSSSSSNAGETHRKKQRRVSATAADASFDRIVTDQFDQNMALLADALRDKQGAAHFPPKSRTDWPSGGGVPSPVAWHGGGPEYLSSFSHVHEAGRRHVASGGPRHGLRQPDPHSTRCRRRCREGHAHRRHSCFVVRVVGASGAQGLLLASSLP